MAATQPVLFEGDGLVLALRAADADPSDRNVAAALVAATEEFKRGCSCSPPGDPWLCEPCTQAYLGAVRKVLRVEGA